MSELKTRPTSQNATDFLNTIEPEQKRADGLALLELFQATTGEKAVMWGTSMVGFGSYHYKSERSKQEGEWPLVAFAPRKQNLTLYGVTGHQGSQEVLKRLGKHKTGVGCIYINKLADVDKSVLRELIAASFQFMKNTNKT